MKRKKLPVENLARDIARQPNEFTDAVFKGTATAYKLIIFALYKAVDAPPEKDKPVIFSQNEFFERMGLSLGTNSYRIVDRAADELAESFLSFKNPRAKDPKDVYICKMPWFSRVEVTYERDLHLFFNPVISQFFDLRLGFTAIDLLEIGNLRSFYAMRYYGFARSKSGFSGKNGNKNHEWWFEFTEEEIRKIFGIEDNEYQRRERFVTKVIKDPCKEVSDRTSLMIELEPTKLGKGRYRWKFCCHDKAETIAITNKDSRENAALKKEMNAENILLQELIEKNPDEWRDLMNDQVNNPLCWSGGEVSKGFFSKEFAIKAAGAAMLRAHDETAKPTEEVPDGQLDLF